MFHSVQEVLLFIVPCTEVEVGDGAVKLFGFGGIVEVPGKENEAIIYKLGFLNIVLKYVI